MLLPFAATHAGWLSSVLRRQKRQKSCSEVLKTLLEWLLSHVCGRVAMAACLQFLVVVGW